MRISLRMFILFIYSRTLEETFQQRAAQDSRGFREGMIGFGVLEGITRFSWGITGYMRVSEVLRVKDW